MVTYGTFRKAILLLFLSFAIPAQGWGATWYVRSSSGEYGSENGTSYDTAFDGFSGISWGSVSPGDTVYVCGTFTGEYNATGKSGTSGNHITLDGSCPGGSPGVLDANNSGNRALRIQNSYLTVKNLEAKNYGSQYGVNAGNVNSRVTDVILDNLNVHNGNNAGIFVSGIGVKVLNSQVHDISDSGIWIVGSTSQPNVDIEIAYNTIYNIGTAGQNDDGISASNGSGNISIHHNIVTNVARGTNGSSCIDQSSGSGFPPTTVNIFNNYISDCQYGIGVGDESVYDTLNVYNNVLGDAVWALVIRPYGDYRIYNNTFIGSGSIGMFIYSAGSINRTVNSRNNIFSGTYSDLLSYTTSGLTMTSDYNNYCKLPNCSNDGFSGQDSHSMNVNPLFASSTDYHLQAGSPLIDAGADVGLPSNYGGLAPDIGAGGEIGPGDGGTGTGTGSSVPNAPQITGIY